MTLKPILFFVCGAVRRVTLPAGDLQPKPALYDHILSLYGY
jgi:hypothetical protein